MEKQELKIEEKSDLIKNAIEIVRKLQDQGFEAYFAGGAVRDLYLKRELHDIDIATSARPDEVKKLFPTSYDRGKAFGVVAIKTGDLEYEVATFRSDIGIADHRRPVKVEFVSAVEDAKRRDFTINALFYDPEKEEIIDYVNGLEDLDKKIIHFVGKPDERIDEDYLRMLRAVKFANRLEFTLEDNTFKAIKKNAHLIKRISAERIREELNAILVNENRVEALRQMDKIGLLKEIMPEVLAMKNVAQSPEFHSEGDVWEHTLLALSDVDNPTVELVWTVLLHDIGKPETKAERDVPNRPKLTFFEHDKLSAEIAQKILERLKFSNEFIASVTWAINQHMRIINAFRGMSERKQKKLFTDPNIQLLLDLTQADLGASLRTGMKQDLSMYREAVAKKEAFEKQAQNEEKNQIKKFTLITGRDIMELLKIPSGPKVGEIKSKIEEAFLEGKISKRDEAIKMIEELK